MKLSEKIIYLRKQQGMSQEELSSKLNVSRQAVSRWEGGSALPDALNILQLSKLFEVSADYLLNDEYENEEDLPEYQKKVQEENSQYQDKLRLIAGFGISGISLIGMLILGILGSIKRVLYIRNDVEYTGVTAYLKFYNLEWLFTLLIIILIIGIILIFWTRIETYIKQFQLK